MVLGFHCEVDENCSLIGYYAASSGNSLPMFSDKLSVPSSRVKNAETSVRNYHYSLYNKKERSFQMLINLALEENSARMKVLLFRRKETLSVKHVYLRDMFKRAAKCLYIIHCSIPWSVASYSIDFFICEDSRKHRKGPWWLWTSRWSHMYLLISCAAQASKQ